MFFPIAGVMINPFILAATGFVVGILGGFFGVGGGFIAGPMMFLAGVPLNFVIGTDLAHMTGKSIVAARRHRTLGHVDTRLGLLMALGTIPGIEAGARIIELLEASGNIDFIVGGAYVVILLIISVFTAWESLRAIGMERKGRISTKDALGFSGGEAQQQIIRIPPMIELPDSGIAAVSIWAVLGVGFVTGILVGVLGVGGGFLRMPLLVYLLGVPTHVAVGTDLFSVVISAGFGTITHAFKGNVDILIALVMHTGAAIGAQIGAVSTRFVSGPRIRLVFSTLPLIGAILVLARLITGLDFG
jgi:uncharacterized membrane protein YfcA